MPPSWRSFLRSWKWSWNDFEHLMEAKVNKKKYVSRQKQNLSDAQKTKMLTTLISEPKRFNCFFFVFFFTIFCKNFCCFVRIFFVLLIFFFVQRMTNLCFRTLFQLLLVKKELFVYLKTRNLHKMLVSLAFLCDTSRGANVYQGGGGWKQNCLGEKY